MLSPAPRVDCSRTRAGTGAFSIFLLAESLKKLVVQEPAAPLLPMLRRRVLGDDDLRERCRSRGLERAALFTWEATAHGTLKLYREALRRN